MQLPEQERRELCLAQGWTQSDIKAFEEEKRMPKVQYLANKDERAPFALNLAGTITQGRDPNTKAPLADLPPYDTADSFTNGIGQGHAMYVMSSNGVVYAASHRIGHFHHSSFKAGGNVAAAGSIKVVKGKITEISNKSGHYKPSKNDMVDTVKIMRSNGADVANTKMRVWSWENNRLEESVTLSDIENVKAGYI